MTNPTPEFEPFPAPPKKSHKAAWIIGSAVALVVLLCIGAVSLIASAGDTPRRANTPGLSKAKTAAPVEPGVQPATTEPTTPAASLLTKSDVKLTLKVTSKDCFGSAGCNVDVQVKASADYSKLGNNSWDVTYSIKGDEDGPTIGTLTLDPDGTYNVREESLSTKSSGTKISVTVTEVEKVGL